MRRPERLRRSESILLRRRRTGACSGVCTATRSFRGWPRPVKWCLQITPPSVAIGQFVAVFKSSSMVMISSQLGQCPPVPMRRANRWQSGQRRSPARRSPQSGHSKTPTPVVSRHWRPPLRGPRGRRDGGAGALGGPAAAGPWPGIRRSCSGGTRLVGLDAQNQSRPGEIESAAGH